MFLPPYPMKSISLNSFVLLEHLAVDDFNICNKLLTQKLLERLSVSLTSQNFLNFIDDIMIWYVNSKLDLYLSCAKVFQFYGDLVFELKKIFYFIYLFIQYL